jgi:hypothetical protein
MKVLAQAAIGSSHNFFTARILTVFLSAATLTLGCGSSASTAASSTTTTSTGTPNAYTTVYKSMTWGSTVTVTFPSTCEMTVKTSGKPNYTPNAYYLAPAAAGQTAVAYTAVSNTALAVISYASVIAPSLTGSSATLNICPTLATTTTATSMGAIGYLISGTDLFNPFEMDGSTAAVADNASYTFTDSTGTQQTAYFLDRCASHSNGSTWHAHGNPSCITSQVDTATGPSHIIGIALDGFPVYGGRDINGNIVNVSQLDACNGITSATPEFPSGAYHYVLPIGVSSKYASINCYSGTVSGTTVAAAKRLACNMKMMFAMIESEQQKSRQKPRETMAGMDMREAGNTATGSM